MILGNMLFAAVALALFALAIIRFEDIVNILEFSVFSWLLIIFLINDLRHWFVPRSIVFLSVFLGFMFGLFNPIPNLNDRIIGAFSGLVSLWCVLISTTWILRKTQVLGQREFAMGAGDPWLLAVIGAFMGLLMLPSILFFACLQSIVVHFVFKICGYPVFHSPWKYACRDAVVPFGSFMCLAALEIIIWPAMPQQFWSIIRSIL